MAQMLELVALQPELPSALFLPPPFVVVVVVVLFSMSNSNFAGFTSLLPVRITSSVKPFPQVSSG